MSYSAKATTATPAFIIYLLDMSASMKSMLNGQRKVDIVTANLTQVAREMVVRSLKGRVPAARYRVAIFAYNDQVRNLLGGAIPITELIELGVPTMDPSGSTDTALAFGAAEELLRAEFQNISTGPAPLICHLTDGQVTGADPAPIVERIRSMNFADGPVLVENIFFDAQALPVPIANTLTWPGVSSAGELATTAAQRLFAMSSPIPASYLELFRGKGYSLIPSARMMFPGDSPEIMAAAFAMSTMTPLA